MHHGLGNVAEDIRVGLDLIVEVTGDVAKVIKRTVQRNQVSYPQSRACLGLSAMCVKLLVDIGWDEPFAQGTGGVAQVCGDDIQVGDHGRAFSATTLKFEVSCTPLERKVES